MASFRISFKSSVEKDLRKIDRAQVPRVVEAIQKLADDPHPAASRQLVGSEKAFRLRVGDYRVVYMVFADSGEIVIERVGHRKDVYR